MPKVYLMLNIKLPLTVWPQHFGRFNFPSPQKYLSHHGIYYNNTENKCNCCEKAKITKHYNCICQNKVKRSYQFVNTDFVGPITPVRFVSKR